MKKIIAISMVAISIAATSAFGQGYFTFTAGKSQAYDGFTTAGSSATSANVDLSFLWAASGTATGLPVASTLTSGNSTTPAATAGYSVQTAWTDILNGTFTLAVNSATSATVVQQTAANGSAIYNGGVSFGVAGTSPSTTYTVYIIGWNAAYATPQAAAAAGSAVGWSTPFSYAAVTSIGTGASMASSGANFGTFIPVATPEPATMALFALGGASVLLFRRRK